MENIIPQLLVGVFISIAASLLGVFAVLKRMSLVGDALSHVALPGLALAVFLKINPFLGALMFLFVSVVGIWLLEYRSKLSVETIVGVFFTSSLALGALLIPQLELFEALFGDISKLTYNDVFLSVFFSIVLIVILLAVYKKLALHMVSQDLAYSIGIKSKQLEFVYLMLFALGVALGIKFIGALLMGALIIIPAAAAKNVSRSLKEFMFLSAAFGAVSAVLGIYISDFYSYPPGPIFILVGAVIFMLSFIWRMFKR
ncbi:MAG: ABC-3 protein [Parcubacteria group bacterium Athens0714_26]|nr:MAG: ABC-3 protein [Parcubacteria group bacterium Athens1014_26]TSD02958.1 MAG: ABC-3 protein [Parcubacteria group bacterium Athens0714_26]